MPHVLQVPAIFQTIAAVGDTEEGDTCRNCRLYSNIVQSPALSHNCSWSLAPQVAACGKSSLAALADWKPPTVTPLAEPKHRAPRGQGGGSGHDEHGEAFSAAAVHSLFDR